MYSERQRVLLTSVGREEGHRPLKSLSPPGNSMSPSVEAWKMDSGLQRSATEKGRGRGLQPSAAALQILRPA